MHNTQTDYSKRKQEQYIPASGGSQPLRAAITRKRIGSTTYRVSVHFSAYQERSRRKGGKRRKRAEKAANL